MKGSLRLIRVLGNIALYRIDLRRDGEETGITLKQCTHEDIPQVLPEARRMSDTVFAVVDNVEPSSTEGQMGVRKGDFVCDENYGMYKLADFETATLANSKLQCRLFLIRDLSKGSLPVDQRAGKRNEEGKLKSSLSFAHIRYEILHSLTERH